MVNLQIITTGFVQALGQFIASWSQKVVFWSYIVCYVLHHSVLFGSSCHEIQSVLQALFTKLLLWVKIWSYIGISNVIRITMTPFVKIGRDFSNWIVRKLSKFGWFSYEYFSKIRTKALKSFIIKGRLQRRAKFIDGSWLYKKERSIYQIQRVEYL